MSVPIFSFFPVIFITAVPTFLLFEYVTSYASAFTTEPSLSVTLITGFIGFPV